MARKKLPRGIREKGSAYEARAIVNGIKLTSFLKMLSLLTYYHVIYKNQSI